MYQLSCIGCRTDFKHNFSHTKFCTSKCRKFFYSNKYNRKVTGLKIPSGTVGTIAELNVSMDLMKKGYAVFRALSPACYCDLIAIEPEKKIRLELEVRTGYKDTSGKMQFPITLSIYNNGNVTGYAVMERNTGEILYYDLNKLQIEI